MTIVTKVEKNLTAGNCFQRHLNGDQRLQDCLSVSQYCHGIACDERRLLTERGRAGARKSRSAGKNDMSLITIVDWLIILEPNHYDIVKG